MVWNVMEQALTCVIAAINKRSLTSLSFFQSIEVNKTKNQLAMLTVIMYGEQST